LREHFRIRALAFLVAAGICCSAGLASDANAAGTKTQAKAWRPPIGAYTGDPDIGSNKTPPPGSIVRRPEGGEDVFIIPTDRIRWVWVGIRERLFRGGW
jgi:hypothetical protein